MSWSPALLSLKLLGARSEQSEQRMHDRSTYQGTATLSSQRWVLSAMGGRGSLRNRRRRGRGQSREKARAAPIYSRRDEVARPPPSVCPPRTLLERPRATPVCNSSAGTAAGTAIASASRPAALHHASHLVGGEVDLDRAPAPPLDPLVARVGEADAGAPVGSALDPPPRHAREVA